MEQFHSDCMRAIALKSDSLSKFFSSWYNDQLDNMLIVVIYLYSGSLVVRLVFLPFEESSYTTFARSASGLYIYLSSLF